MALNLSQKVAGIPVVYIAGGAVAVITVVAWRMKDSPDVTDGPAEGEDAIVDENGLADGTNPYGGLATNGTVIVQQPKPEPVDTEPDRPMSNEEWVRRGAEWLVKERNVSGPSAYIALEKYLAGKSRSTQEAQWVEAVIKVQGFPPESFNSATPTPTPNQPVGPAPGSKPGYGWVKVNAGDTAAGIASKYGLSVTTFYAFNGKDRLKVGEYVKVRASSNPTWGYRG